MIAYKLFRVMKDESIASLFINKKDRLQKGKWLKSECFPTNGFAVRKGWHCTSNPKAPHLSMKGRKWYEVEIESFTELKRPVSQGGMWYLADKIKIINEVKQCK